MTNLNIKIENLIGTKVSDFEISKVIKDEVKQYLISLDNIFIQTQGKDFFVQHTKKIDEFIKVIYKYLLRKYFGYYLPMSNSIPITLVALGSFGREQLCVYSDVDIMILYEDILGYNIQPLIEEFITIAWDSGLKLGSRVHKLQDIEEAVKTDITIKTAILESRLIYGSKHLWYIFQNHLANVREFEQKEFVLAKLQEHKERLLKYPLTMQPNIKDGYGGMRESNLLFWIANITYGVNNTNNLIGVLFDENEYKKYRSSLEYIFRIRNALHLVAKKKLDTINFDILPELSEKLGFKGTKKLVKERQLMAKLFESLHNVHRFTSAMVKKISRQYTYESKNISCLPQYRYQKNLYIINNKIYSSFFNKHKQLNQFLKELIHLPDDIKKFDNSYIYYASKTKIPKTINDTTKKFILMLLHKKNISGLFKLLYNAGLFRKVLPSLKKIINQPQFDGYHIHPVDIHSIKTLKYVENITDEFVRNIYESLCLKDQSLVKISALFHDSGKGRGKDHHIVSMQLFKKFGKLINLDEKSINLIAKIIRYHNMMSKVATTEDIYSQDVILKFTALVGDIKSLKMLYILTYADINAVDQKVYTSSTASLLKELFLQSLPAFENTELLKVSSRRLAKQNAIVKLQEFKSLSRLLQKRILSISSNDIFLRYKALDIVKISKYAYETNEYYFTIENQNYLTIRLTRVNPLNLGFLLYKLSFLNITSMGIYKLFDNKKFFEIVFDQKVDDSEIGFIKDIISNSFDMNKNIKIKKPNIYLKDVSINCNHSESLAELKIVATDQKGLFAFVAKILDDYKVEINSAKIHTKNNKINDLLLIDKNGTFCKNKGKILDKIT